jgi:pSer/pThr/pTyr-binding forkhead associated (FHA) protein
MEYGILRVTTPDGQVREYPIESVSMTLGRSLDNGITVDHVSVSRRHAHLKIEDGKLQVQDIGSATGTFVGSQRVSTTEFVTVDEGQVMRFGDCEARFLTESDAPAGTATSSVTGPEGQPTIAVSLASPSQPINPGSATTATVTVHNRGKRVDQVALSIPELPAGWAQIRRPSLSLAPGARDEVTIVLQPPKKSESTAGEHEFAVAAMSSEQGREVRVLGRFTILPYDDFKFAMKGPQGKSQFTLTVSNLGNAPADYALSANDEEDGLDYELAEESLQLGPGEERNVTMKVAAKKKNPFGQNKSYRFTTTARPSSGATAATASSYFRYNAPLKNWKYFLGAFLGISFLSVAGLMSLTGSLPSFGGGSSADPTATTNAGTTTEPSAAVATPTPDHLYVGASAEIINSPTGDCLRIRQGPTLTDTDPESAIIGRLCDGQIVSVTDGPVEASGFMWWQVETSDGLSGWAAEGSADDTGDKFMALEN